MNSNLLFDFTVDKEKKTIHVTREFAANLTLVWDAWTKPELLDLWFAPKPYQTRTKSMDFREGGFWHYAMVSPDNVAHWNRTDYKKIEYQKSISALDAFADEAGNVNPDFPRSQFTNVFREDAFTTTVSITIVYQSLSDLEKVVQMGFKEGLAMTLNNLEQYIEAQFKLRSAYKKDNAPRVCTYLNFPGNTEEAFLFYQSVFKSEFAGGGIQRFGDLPADADHPPVAEALKKMVLHVELPITGNHILMGTDAPKEMGFTLVQGNNMHISIEPETREEATRLFDQLSVGGKIDMPMQDMFFGAYFGSFTDKYGINWMINFQTKK
ncbi:SRPBCC domain-containing protein [Flavitalea sp. BT771]|uniref:SRPBCC domain-containing protein n=1 Tax=Flavitalea sp. BT771 TaxID=3063329 RepID=UPI0026E1A8B2|nr:SRPBCC domain-containing protein [Flavitalea sp. BT771]MDO6432721.1 SRPBCC domain-containing protein [Flavitalea sp. BT771]MDV6222003.1 SRPBCC domain-containing protein [Flavitalea sp. BT771]